MKTLVIHPDDPSTSFLEKVYTGRGWTEITDVETSKKKLIKAIKSHDRIVMMGHGSPKGLFAKGRIIIDSTYVHYLKDKEIVAIWCNADQFVLKYDLKGFYTGMIISELEESYWCSVPARLSEIDESNVLFTDAVTNSIDSGDMLGNMINEYVTNHNEVIYYNSQNLYKR